jgi:hypothetical protein
LQRICTIAITGKEPLSHEEGFHDEGTRSSLFRRMGIV